MSSSQPMSTVLFFIFIAMILPAIVIWVDEILFVDELEKEQRESEKGGHMGAA